MAERAISSSIVGELSSYMFILSVKIMAEAIRKRKVIVGVTVNEKEIK